MANKLETSYSGMFLDTKLKTILDDLNKELINSRLSTKEDVASLFNKIIRDFHKNLNRSLLNYKPVSVGSDPDVNKLNTDFFLIYNDLKIIYSSLANTRNLLASNYNTLAGMSLKLKSDIAETSSKLIDYKIQNTNKSEQSFSDSFFNLSKIETDEKKYTTQKVFIDTFNNNVVLPLDKEATTGTITRIQIVENSVGTSGNNQEVGSIARDNLKLAVDNANDTWFEFEQVGANELQLPTSLNLKIELEEEIFFNLLDIDTVQMPNGSYPAILDIRGSIDGSSFFDLKPLFLGELTRDSVGNTTIQLGEVPENPTGSNLLYFTPRKIKYLTIRLIEDSSYFIRTSSGVKYRRAIGLKEIKLKSQKFKNKGQLITSNFLSNKEISKIALFTKEYAPANFKSTFNYFISVDNGQNWEAISPTEKVKDKIPEILNYNIDYVDSSKKTDFPVASIKLKADITLEEGDETTSVTSSYTTKNQTEFLSLAAGAKVLSLKNKPFGSVHIYKTNYGSVGKDSYLKMSISSIKEMQDRYVIQLPLDVFPPASIQKDQEVFFIDNYTWTRVDSIDSSHNTNSLVYEFDYINNIATFNKLINSSRAGKKPNGDIQFRLNRENIELQNNGEQTIFVTNFMHDAIKENISIYTVSNTVSEKEYKLRNLASVHRLGIEEIDGITINSDLPGILTAEKPFVNGVIELATNGDYSIDKKRGVIYTYKSLTATDEILVTAVYREKNPVNFSIEDGKIVTSDILTKENKTFKVNIVDSYAIDLGFKNIEARSIVFSEYPEQLIQEVPYANMEVEFNTAGTSGKYAIDYKNGILHVQNKVTGKVSGTLVNTNYFGEYNIAYKIPETSYKIIVDQRNIEFVDKFVSDYFNTSTNEIGTASLLKVEYNYTEEVKESLTELFPYTTPFIMEYKIVTTPKESL